MKLENYTSIRSCAVAMAGLILSSVVFAQSSSSIPVNFTDISGTGTAVVLGDDELSTAIPLDFPFEFFGEDKTQIAISSNGFLSFSEDSNGCCSGDPIPSVDTPNDMIAMFWEDLDPPEGAGAIYYETIGSAPFRQFVVQFDAVEHFPSGNPDTMQAKLTECSNQIELHYVSAPSDGGDHTAGIENFDGTAGVQVAFGDVSFTDQAFLIDQGTGGCFTAVPTMNRWGLVLLTLLVLAVGGLSVRRVLV